MLDLRRCRHLRLRRSRHTGFPGGTVPLVGGGRGASPQPPFWIRQDSVMRTACEQGLLQNSNGLYPLSNVIMWIFNESIMSLKLDRLQEVTDLNLLDRFEQITINCIYQAAAFWNLKSIIFCIWHWNQFVWSINFGSGMKSKESGKGIFTSYNVWTVRCAVGQNTNTNVYKYTLG